jgi:hypothetical protein
MRSQAQSLWGASFDTSGRTERHTQWANVGARNAAQGRPQQVQPPRGAESHTQWANVGAH